MDKGQQMRFSKKELEVIKGAFENNDDLLYSLRKHLLQCDIPEDEWVNLKKTVNPELLAVLRKDFLPTINDDVPLQQIADPLLLEKIMSLPPEEAAPHIEAALIAKEYTKQQIDELETGDKGKIVLKKLTPKIGEPTKNCLVSYVNLMARNIIISNTESRLYFLRILANQNNPAIQEEFKKKLEQNSNK